MPPVLNPTESHLKFVVYFSTEIRSTFKVIYTSFVVDSTVFNLGGGNLVKVELSYLDEDGNKFIIAQNDNANNISKGWKKFSSKLTGCTGKKVTINQLVEDMQGKIHPRKNFLKNQWKIQEKPKNANTNFFE